MGISKPNPPATVLLLALTLTGMACHGDKDKRQARLPAPQANAPALGPVLAALPQTITDAQPAPPQSVQNNPDPVADLIANAEK